MHFSLACFCCGATVMTSFVVKTFSPDEKSNGIVIASQQCFCVPHPAVHLPQHADFVIIEAIYVLFSFSSMNGDDEGDGPDWGCREFRDTLVETFPLLSSDDAVNVQLVCKAWKQASHGTAYPIVKAHLWGPSDALSLSAFLHKHRRVCAVDVSTADDELPIRQVQGQQEAPQEMSPEASSLLSLFLNLPPSCTSLTVSHSAACPLALAAAAARLPTLHALSLTNLPNKWTHAPGTLPWVEGLVGGEEEEGGRVPGRHESAPPPASPSWGEGMRVLRRAREHAGGPDMQAAMYGRAVWHRFQEYWERYEAGVHAVLRAHACTLRTLALEAPARSLCPGIINCLSMFTQGMPSPPLTNLELVGLGGKASSNPAFGEDSAGVEVGALAGALGAGLTRLVLSRCGVAPVSAQVVEGLTGLKSLSLSCTTILFSDRAPQLSRLHRLETLNMEQCVWGGHAAAAAAAVREGEGRGSSQGGGGQGSSVDAQPPVYLFPDTLTELNLSGFESPVPLSLEPLTALTALSLLEFESEWGLHPLPSRAAASALSPFTHLRHLSADGPMALALLRGAGNDGSSRRDGGPLSPQAAPQAPLQAPQQLDTTSPSQAFLSGAFEAGTQLAAAAAGLLASWRLGACPLTPSPSPAPVPLPLPALHSLTVWGAPPQALHKHWTSLPQLTRLTFSGALGEGDDEPGLWLGVGHNSDDSDNSDDSSSDNMSQTLDEVACMAPPPGCLSCLVELSLDIGCLGYRQLALSELGALTRLKVDNVEFVDLRATHLPPSLCCLELFTWYGLPELYYLHEGDQGTRVVDLPPKVKRLEREVAERMCALISSLPNLATLHMMPDMLTWAQLLQPRRGAVQSAGVTAGASVSAPVPEGGDASHPGAGTQDRGMGADPMHKGEGDAVNAEADMAARRSVGHSRSNSSSSWDVGVPGSAQLTPPHKFDSSTDRDRREADTSGDDFSRRPIFMAPALRELYMMNRQALCEPLQELMSQCCPSWTKVVLGQGTRRSKYIKTPADGSIVIKTCGVSVM